MDPDGVRWEEAGRAEVEEGDTGSVEGVNTGGVEVGP